MKEKTVITGKNNRKLEFLFKLLPSAKKRHFFSHIYMIQCKKKKLILHIKLTNLRELQLRKTPVK